MYSNGQNRRVMEPKWTDYAKIGSEYGLDLYQSKKKSGNPAYAYRSNDGIDWAVADTLTDIRILARECD